MKVNLKNDYLIAGLVYLLGLAITITFSVILNTNITSDHNVTEYEAYRQMLEHGGWLPLYKSNMSACLMSTLVPAILQKILDFKEMLLFTIFPCLFYSMLPAFTYLVARTYLNMSYSLCAVGPILLSSAFVFPEGRVGIAVGFFAGVVWAILTRHTKCAIIFAIFLPFSHYATTYISGTFLVSPLLYFIIRRQFRTSDFRLIGIILVVLITLTFAWFNVVTEMPVKSGETFVKYSKISASTIDPSKDVDYTGGLVSQGEIYDIESRETLVQDAFGRSFGSWVVKKKIAFILSWLVMLLMVSGAVCALYKRVFSLTYRMLVIVAFALLFVGVVIPYISTTYGVGRVYITGLVVLAPMVMYILEVISNKIRVNGVAIGVAVLLSHSWATNGTVQYILSTIL